MLLGDSFSMFLDPGRIFFVKMLLSDDLSMFLDPGRIFFRQNVAGRRIFDVFGPWDQLEPHCALPGAGILESHTCYVVKGHALAEKAGARTNFSYVTGHLGKF